MPRLRTSLRSARLCLLLGLSALGTGCGRRLLGRLPAGSAPDAASDAGTVLVDASPVSDAAVRPDASPPGTPPVDLPQACTSDGWCWTHPLPTSDRFVQAFGLGGDDLWLLGASGIILRFFEGSWSTLPAPTDGLSAVWASSASDVWVGGAAGPYHWDGQTWTLFALPTAPGARAVNGLWGCAPDDVWAVGPVVTHWDGQRWSYVDMPVTPGSYRAVWGAACDDVWVGFLDDALGSGKIAHWDGGAWTTTETRPAERIAGTGADDVWSLAQGQLYHWSGLGPGTLLSSRALDLFPVGAAAVGTMDDAHAVSVLARDGGASVLAAPAPRAVAALWGRSANDIWGFGDLGFAARWTGAAWAPRLPGWSLSGDPAVAITGSGPNDLWAVAGATLLHGDGVSWVAALTPEDVGGRIFDVWARAADDVWVLGGDALIHRWNGAAWRTEDPPPRGATTPEMRAISGTSPDDVWIVRGTNSILHWDGAGWISRQPFIDNVNDVWAAGPNECWVVGDGASHWHDDAWHVPPSLQSIGRLPLTAVGGGGSADVWILAGGYVLKANGDAAALTVAMNTDWNAAALSPAPGAGGVWVLFQNGTAPSRLYRVNALDDIAPALLAPAGLDDLWAAPDGALWAAGEGGALLRRAPGP